MTNSPNTTVPSLRMPRQAAGVNRHGRATGATSDGGVEPAILPLAAAAAALPYIMQIPVVQQTVDDAKDWVSGAISDIGDFFSGLFS
jgi:hypothetical protein